MHTIAASTPDLSVLAKTQILTGDPRRGRHAEDLIESISGMKVNPPDHPHDRNLSACRDQ